MPYSIEANQHSAVKKQSSAVVVNKKKAKRIAKDIDNLAPTPSYFNNLYVFFSSNINYALIVFY